MIGIISVILGLVLFGILNSVMNITYFGGKALITTMATCMLIVYFILKSVFA